MLIFMLDPLCLIQPLFIIVDFSYEALNDHIGKNVEIVVKRISKLSQDVNVDFLMANQLINIENYILN